MDDHSQDRTEEIADRSGAKCWKRCQHLRDGLAKPGLVFRELGWPQETYPFSLDADKASAKNGLDDVILTYIENDRVVSIQPHQTMHNLHEQLSTSPTSSR